MLERIPPSGLRVDENQARRVNRNNTHPPNRDDLRSTSKAKEEKKILKAIKAQRQTHQCHIR